MRSGTATGTASDREKGLHGARPGQDSTALPSNEESSMQARKEAEKTEEGMGTALLPLTYFAPTSPEKANGWGQISGRAPVALTLGQAGPVASRAPSVPGAPFPTGERRRREGVGDPLLSPTTRGTHRLCGSDVQEETEQ